MKLLRLLFLAALPIAACALPSDPVGALRLKLRGNSDTIVSLPLHRPALLTATVTARDGNTLTLDRPIPTSPTSGAYALVMTGHLEGAVLPVVSQHEDTFTIDETAYDLSALETGASGAVITVIPYWTLDTIFPEGRGVHVTTSVLSPKTRVMLYDENFIGINEAPAQTFIYFSGHSSKAAGWYRSGDMSALRGGQVIPPYTHIMVRHPNLADTELLVAGSVQMSASLHLLETHQAGTAQDNRLAVPSPVPITLASSGLGASVAFKPTTSVLTPKDLLLFFDNRSVGQNKSASATYIYFDGNGAPADGWYRTGSMSETADSFILNPGEGIVVRKRQTTSPERHVWKFLPTYLQ